MLCLLNIVLLTGLRLPPGPPGRLLFGNASDMPTHHAWEKFTEWRKEYGQLLRTIILESAGLTLLCARRSRVHQGAEHEHDICELCGYRARAVRKTLLDLLRPVRFSHDESVGARLPCSRRRLTAILYHSMGFEWDFGIMPYGERWRRHRKTFNDKFHQTAVIEYQDVQVKQTR